MLESVMERRIMWGDLDALGIVFYPRYYEWFDGGAHQFFEAAGIPHDRLWKEHGLVLGLAETRCRYLSAGRYHERIKILTRLRDLNRRGLILEHLVIHATDGRHMAAGTEKRVCMDAANPLGLKTAAIPETVYRKLEQTLANDPVPEHLFTDP